MSLIMTLVARGDPDALERRAAENPDAIRAIAEKAKEHGLIAHRFYGSDGQMVVDEWPDEASFPGFFEEMQPEIGPMTAAVGVTSEPAITFWRKLETRDDVGWNA